MDDLELIIALDQAAAQAARRGGRVMDNLELLLAQALCNSGGSRHNPCRYHVAGARAVLNAIAGAGMIVVPRESTEIMAVRERDAMIAKLKEMLMTDEEVVSLFGADS